MPPAHTQGALSGLLGRTAVAGHAAAPATASARPCRKKGPKSKSMSVDRASLHIPGRPIALRRLAGRGTEGLEAPQGRGQGRGPARRYQGVYGGVAGGAARPGARARAGGPRGRGPRAATGITAGGGGGRPTQALHAACRRGGDVPARGLWAGDAARDMETGHALRRVGHQCPLCERCLVPERPAGGGESCAPATLPGASLPACRLHIV